MKKIKKSFKASFHSILMLLLLMLSLGADAQSDTISRGAWARREIDHGDTIFVMSLPIHRVSAKRTFKDFTEQRQYYLYFRAAKRVYPYAVQAIDLYNQILEETEGMSNRKRKRHIRHENKELKEEFTDRMKNLSKTEGKVLIKMIERQLNKPFYTVIKETRGGFTATYWNSLGKMWGYDLKDGYSIGKDSLLDEVLLDYDFGASFYRY